MKKTTIIILLFSIIKIYPQGFFIMNTQVGEKPINLIQKDRAYSAIINTNFEKNNLINTLKNFLIEEELTTEENLKTVVYDENLSQFVIRLGFKQGQTKSKGMLGASYIAPPIYLYFDAQFSFNSLGQIKVTFTNLSTDVITRADDSKHINRYKGGKSDGTQLEPILDADKAIEDEYLTISMTESTIGKVLLVANGQMGEIQKINRGDYRKNLRDQFSMYEKAMKNGSSVIINLKNMNQYIGDKFWEEQGNAIRNNNLVLALDNQRWDNYFEYNFNYFFKEISNLVNGNISKIALDGNIKFEDLNGKLLPTDVKERKKWIKDGIEF